MCLRDFGARLSPNKYRYMVCRERRFGPFSYSRLPFTAGNKHACASDLSLCSSALPLKADIAQGRESMHEPACVRRFRAYDPAELSAHRQPERIHMRAKWLRQYAFIKSADPRF
jgi:hypothetical protein